MQNLALRYIQIDMYTYMSMNEIRKTQISKTKMRVEEWYGAIICIYTDVIMESIILYSNLKS